ncbi:MAG: metalloregulator ArsR/SmtB family transcription factor [Candidatus Bathyarchaeota archaeon]|nr:metalloregulator ArsR/SmtB family transcription factor [Candidatus Bathyarchaeota archaeon]
MSVNLPEDRVLEFKARLFKVIADPNRLKILEILRSGEHCQCDIIPVIGQSQPTVSRHLRLLEEAGLLLKRKEGTKVIYRVLDEHIFNLIDVLDDSMMRLISEEIAKKFRI